jgi:hypothetical protein
MGKKDGRVICVKPGYHIELMRFQDDRPIGKSVRVGYGGAVYVIQYSEGKEHHKEYISDVT